MNRRSLFKGLAGMVAAAVGVKTLPAQGQPLVGVARNLEPLYPRSVQLAAARAFAGADALTLDLRVEGVPEVIAALEAAHHELTTLNGLVVADGAVPHETFALDTTPTLRKIEAALPPPA